MRNKILKFEFRSRFTNWMTLLFILMMIFQGIWYTKGFYDFYGGEGMMINAAGVFYQNLAGGGILMMIIIAIITGPMLYKDVQYKTANWLYTLPINDKSFFWGRFFSAFLINVVIASFYMVGLWLVPYSGIGESNLFGPTPFDQIFHGFFILTIPNIFLLTSLCFAAVVFFRRPAAGYLAIFLTVIFFLLMETSVESSGATSTNLIFDPFAYVPVKHQVTLMSIPERNQSYISLSGYLLTNRILWLSIALICVTLAYLKFSFKSFSSAGKKRKKIKTIYGNTVPGSITLTSSNQITDAPKLSYDTSTLIKKLGNLATLEFKNIVRTQGFRMILGILVLFSILQNLMWNASYYIGPQVPVTSEMTNFRVTFGVFVIMLLMIWSGELFFKDKTANIWQIMDALPVPVWVTQVSKLLAMFGVAFLLNIVFMLCGILAMIVKGGFANIDLALFINDYLGYNWGWLNHCLFIALVFFVAGLTGKRFLTHILATGYFFLLLVTFEFNLIEQLRFGYGFTPGFEEYSEMNGYGMWRTASAWYFLMWFVLAIALVLLGILFWDRGIGNRLINKLQFKSTQLNIVGKLSVLVLLFSFIFLQSFIYQQVNGKDNFELSKEADASAADYERKYLYLSTKIQPKYAKVDLKLDYYPMERRAEYMVDAQLKNIHSIALDSIVLSLPDHIAIHSIRIENEDLTSSLIIDDLHDVVKFKLPSVLNDGDTLAVRMDLIKDFDGFTQEEPQASLVYRGAFGSIDDYLPFIGFDETKMLTENRARAEQGLSRLGSLLPDLKDTFSLKESIYRNDALPITGTLTLSTTADQVLIGPGQLINKEQKENRNYAIFQIQEASPLNWYLGTAPHIETKKKETANNIDIQVFYNPDHPYNVSLYQGILEQAINFVEQNLAYYPFPQVRLYEIPHYQDPFYSFARGIAISEKEGWIADTTGIKERAYLYQTTATGIFQQWVQANLNIANVQGADMLRIALPEALSLQFVQNSLGEEAVNLLIEQKKQIYNKDRFSDPNGEPPLLYADGKDYLEANHGAITLYIWSEKLGFNQFNKLVLEWKEQNQVNTFQSLYAELLNRTNGKDQDALRKAFETVSSDN